jgi:probable selenium-dependent hydroxylase accessory protein YqeC
MELIEALDLRRGDVVALVGGGGKTAALYRLGAELSRHGAPVLLCGTARFTPPEGDAPPNLVVVADEAALRRALSRRTSPLTVATGWGSKGRLLPVEPAWLDAVHRDDPELTIVIEADGSAMRPFKAPGEHEPVIPTGATLVVSVVGVDAAGRPLDETHVHRPERVAAISGASVGATVTPEMIAAVLRHPAGGRKGLPAGARWVPLLNKADSAGRRDVAEVVAALLAPAAERVVIAHLKRTPPVARLVTAGSGV